MDPTPDPRRLEELVDILRTFRADMSEHTQRIRAALERVQEKRAVDPADPTRGADPDPDGPR